MKRLFFVLLIMIFVSSSIVFAEEIPSAHSAEIPIEGERPRMPSDGMRGRTREMQPWDENAIPPDFPVNSSGEGFQQGRRGPGGMGGNMGGMPFENNQQTEQTTQSKSVIELLTQNYSTHIATGVALIFGFIFIIFYKS